MREKRENSPARARAEAWRSVKEFIYGLTGYQFVRQATELKHESEALFFLVTLGDFIGIPVMPPAYSLKLLPYVVPELDKWKRELARRKEFWEKEEYDLHGI